MRQVPRAAWPPEAFPPPDLYPRWSAACMAAFYDLSTERAYHLTETAASVGPIPWTAINRWGEARGLRGDELAAFEVVIRRMDAAWLPVEAERLRAAAKGAP